MEPLIPKGFAQAICTEVEKGYGFVPLVGSGLSAPSGIPTGRGIQNYLCHRIEEALKRWDPQGLDWPPLGEDKPNTAWIREQIEQLLRQTTGERTRLTWQAVGALADWRASLQLLSRLRLMDGTPHLGAPNDLVTDSFFRHITRGREPNIGHLMLAHLADVLRIRTILTTNFDSLIEEAFSRLGIPLTAFDVHQKAGLPATHLVLAQRSIVNLHGGRYGLRADFSLDEVPSDDDCRNFAGYLAGAPVPRCGQFNQASLVATRNHLLVMGLSGDDERTLRLIEAALAIAPALRVFWIVYHATGGTEVERLLPPRIRNWDRLTVMSHWNLDLFLLELYQRLTYSLPPPGANYPAFWRVPPRPYCFTAENKTSPEFGLFEKYKSELYEILGAMIKAKAEERLVLLVDGPAGVSSVASEVYDRVQPSCHCVWLELDDFCGLDDLFVTLVESLARCRGIPALAPLAPLGYDDARVDALRRLVEPSDQPFVVFLDGRDGLGSNAGWVSGWKKEGMTDRFWNFLRKVRHIPNSPVTFAVLTRSAEYRTDTRGEAFEPPTESDGDFDFLEMPERCIPHHDKKIVEDTKKWLDLDRGDNPGEATDKQRFVYALTLFRHARHPAALCSWALIKAPEKLRVGGGDNDRERGELGSSWLDEMEKLGAIRPKPGGFAWMHSDVKRNLRDALEASVPRLKDLRSECHQGIADWYVKLFRSCNDPLAALESVYHRLCCIEYATNPEAPCGSPEHIRRTALTEAVTTLELARRRILSCGYFTAPNNLMQEIADQAAKLAADGNPKARQLWRLCSEVRHDFAAGVADFAAALKWNTEIPELPKASSSNSGKGDSTDAGLPGNGGFQQLVLEQRKAHLLTGLRSYETAESVYSTLFQSIGFSLPPPSTKEAVLETRKRAREWLDGPCASQNTLKEVIKALRRYMFLEMLIAQICGLCGQEKERKDRLQGSELVYVAATELMRDVDDPMFLQRENGYIRTNCSVLLANMERFYEAHRRLNEACGYLAQSDMPADSVAWAVVDLRRAEICLRQADALARQSWWQQQIIRFWSEGDQTRTRRALFEDAFEAIERARRRLASRHSNIWWYAWMLELRLMLCQAFVKSSGGAYCGGKTSLLNKCLACSSCPGALKRCRDVLGEAVRVIQQDPLRQARLARLVQEVTKAIDPYERAELLSQARKHLEDVVENRRKQEYDLDRRVKKYVENTLEEVV